MGELLGQFKTIWRFIHRKCCKSKKPQKQKKHAVAVNSDSAINSQQMMVLDYDGPLDSIA